MAVDILARALAGRADNKADQAISNAGGGVPSIPLAADIGQTTVPANISVIATTGFANPGVGAGVYAADTMAEAALGAAYPALCRQSADGRWFRLLADEEGLILLSAAGVIGTQQVDHATNHQPGLQAAIDYAIATGGNGIRADARHYSIWVPLRTPTSTGDDHNTDYTGHPILISEMTEMRAAPNGTSLHRRTNDGSDPAIFANTQQIDANSLTGTQNGRWWRGGMFFLKGKNATIATRPTDYDTMAGLILSGDWNVLGGIPISATPGVVNNADYYEMNADGSGWDMVDKPIWAENDRNTGDIVFDGNIRIDGFRGELLYQGGGVHGSVRQKSGRLTFSNSDANGFNPWPGFSRSGWGSVHCPNVHIHDVWQPFEGWLGDGGVLEGLIEDCPGITMIQGGKTKAGTYAIYYAPGRFQDDQLPMCRVNLTIRNCGDVLLGSYLRGKVTSFDTPVKIGDPNNFGDGVQNTYMDQIDVFADKANLDVGLSIATGNTAGTMLTSDIRVGRVRVGRTKQAVDNGYSVNQAVVWTGGGSYGQRILLEDVEIDCSRSPQGSTGTKPTHYRPMIGRLHHVGTYPSNQPNNTHNIEVDPTIEVAGPVMKLTRTNVGTHAGTLQTNGVQLGERLTLLNVYGDTAYCILTANTRSKVPVTIGPYDQATWEWDGQWKLIESPRDLKVTTNLTLGTIVAGAASGVQTVNVVGAKAGQDARLVLPSSIAGLGALLGSAWVSADGVVSFRIVNVGATDLTLPQADYDVLVGGW